MVIIKNKRRMFTVSFIQVFSSPWFYLATLGVSALCFISIWQYYADYGQYGSVYYYLDLFIGLTMFKKLVVLFAAVPYSASFCSDWNCQYIKPIVIRSGLRKYILSKITTCFITAFLVVFLGVMLFSVLLSLRIPIYPDTNLENYIKRPFEPLFYSPLPILYLIIRVFVFSLASALWSVLGLSISAYIPNRFVAIATPVIASYLLEEASQFLPVWLNIYLLTRADNVINKGPLISFLYFCIIFASLAALAGLIFAYQAERRIRNEVV